MDANDSQTKAAAKQFVAKVRLAHFQVEMGREKAVLLYSLQWLCYTTRWLFIALGKAAHFHNQ